MPAKKEPDSTLSPAKQATPSKLKLWCFRLVAMFGIPLALFGAVEGVLRLSDYGYEPAFLIRDELDAAKLHDNGDFGLRFFPKALARTPQPIRLLEEKPAGTTRILVVGGSAAMGDPEPAYGPARVLQVLLSNRYPGRKFEVVNAAMTAVNSHVVLPIVHDCMRLKPDVVIVYMGNNEVHGPFGSGTVFGKQAPPLWLIRSGLAVKKTKTGQWIARFENSNEGVPESWGGLEMFLKQQVAWNEPKLQTVYRHFENNLRGIVTVAKGADVKVIVSTVAVNLQGFPPFVSLPEETADRWNKLVVDAEAALKRGDFDAALAIYQQAERDTPEHAELQFRIATCLFAAQRHEEAALAFARARDFDALRFRADSRLNKIIRNVARDSGDGVYLIDAEREFAAASKNEIPGDSFFWEHVHLNFAGSHLLGKLLAEKTAAALAITSGESKNSGGAAQWLDATQCMEQLGLTLYHQREIVQFMRERLAVPPFSAQLGHKARQEKFAELAERMQKDMFAQPVLPAIQNFEKRVAAAPDDWLLRKEFASFLTAGGQLDAAIAQRKEITRLLPHSPDAFFQLGSQLIHAKQWKEAEQPLRTALRLRPKYALACNSLGISLSHTDAFDEACAQFAKAIEIMPDYAEAHVNWALVLINKGKTDEGVQLLKAAVNASPNDPAAHYQLGQHFVKQRDFENAAKYYREVVRLVPADPGGYLNLAMVYLALKKNGEAIAQFEQALKLDPANELAREQLQKIRGK